METEKILKKFGIVILIFGILGGVIIMFTRVETGFYKNMEFSTTNIIIGLATIISSVFWWIMCNWFSEMLEKSKEKTKLLSEIKTKMSIIKE